MISRRSRTHSEFAIVRGGAVCGSELCLHPSDEDEYTALCASEKRKSYGGEEARDDRSKESPTLEGGGEAERPGSLGKL
jgi:hypothetical protein